MNESRFTRTRYVPAFTLLKVTQPAALVSPSVLARPSTLTCAEASGVPTRSVTRIWSRPGWQAEDAPRVSGAEAKRRSNSVATICTLDPRWDRASTVPDACAGADT